MCHASFVNSEISRIVTEKYQRCQENAENDYTLLYPEYLAL